MNQKARFNISRVSNYIYSIFLGSYFTDEKLYEVLPEKLVDSDDYFIHFYFANSADENAFGYIDVLCDAYIKHENGRPNWGAREIVEKNFNECLNNYVGGTKMKGYGEFTLQLNNFRANVEEDGYSVITQSIRVMLDYSRTN